MDNNFLEAYKKAREANQNPQQAAPQPKTESTGDMESQGSTGGMGAVEQAQPAMSPTQPLSPISPTEKPLPPAQPSSQPPVVQAVPPPAPKPEVAAPVVIAAPAKPGPVTQKSRRRVWLLAALVVIFLLLLGTIIYLVLTGFVRLPLQSVPSPSMATQSAQPAGNSEKQAQDYIAAVKKLIQVPEGENPTVAVISDVDKMRQTNPFFNAAKNGDVLLLYSTKAILYDPVKNIIIDTAPVTIAGSATPQASQSAGQ